MADIQELLLSKLKGTSSDTPTRVEQVGSPRPLSGLYQPQPKYEAPSVSSPLVSPPIKGPQPRHDDILSLNSTTANTPLPDQAVDRTTNLLNLLKFNQSGTPQASARSNTNSPAVNMGSEVTGTSTIGSAEKPQDMLLNLLKHNPTSSPSPVTVLESQNASLNERKKRESTPIRVFGESPSGQTTPFEPPAPTRVFTYVNPFEKLSASSPRNQESERNATSSVDTAGISQVLNGVTERVHNEPQSAVTREEDRHAMISEESLSARERTELKDAVHNAALEMRDELREPHVRKSVERTMPYTMAEALKETVNQVAKAGDINEAVADNWENADAEEAGVNPPDNASFVQVYNFPMRPFVSISVKKFQPSRLRDDVVLKIASMKREFDQVDRTLIAASPNHIVYAMAKGGGFRVIRQDDGSNNALFRRPENQIFNVSISAPPTRHLSKETESVLAIDTNGAVYWAPVLVDKEKAADDEPEKHGFVFPPVSNPPDDAPAAQLKTRAKKSSRHPEFFAIARGKNISMIRPSVATTKHYINSQNRVVDSEKYLNEHGIKVSTGKSGKDFAFSEDDTVLVSLDKAGKIKFWDLTDHLESLLSLDYYTSVTGNIKTPVMTLVMPVANEKSGPTSIQFLDKERPTVKGIALRYMLVGSRQNHTLQLWDLCLGQAVQELNLPHDNETDGICSVTYHFKSGIIAIGHPTRNSLYLIHLSAPRYNLPSMTQAEYLRRLTVKDTPFPRPESTAIMSGIREISLDSMGDLRSLDLVSPAPWSSNREEHSEEAILELYAMHSRGSSALALKRQDLGWGTDGKVINVLDAAKENIIEVKELKAPEANNDVLASEKIIANGATSTPAKNLKPSGRPGQSNQSEVTPRKKQTTSHSQETVTPAREEAAKIEAFVPIKLISNVDEKRSKLASQPNETSTDMPSPAKDSTQPFVLQAEPGQKEVAQIFRDALEDLYRKINDDKRVQEAAGAAKQDAVLRLVSSTLTDNVEKSLSRIVYSRIEESVIPTILNVTSSTLKTQLSDVMNGLLKSSLPREINAGLPIALTKALQNPDVLKSISDSIARTLMSQMQSGIAASIDDKVASEVKNIASDLANTIVVDSGRHAEAQTNKIELRLQNEATKVDKLTMLIEKLSSTVQQMEQSQKDLRQEIVELRTQLPRSGFEDVSNVSKQVNPVHLADPEANEISGLMKAGKLEEGTLKWIQSTRQSELFDKLFSNYDPSYLSQLSPMVLLSTVAAVSMSFESHLGERLEYLDIALSTLNARHPDISSFVPKVMDVLTERVNSAYVGISRVEPGNEILKRLYEIADNAIGLKAAAG